MKRYSVLAWLLAAALLLLSGCASGTPAARSEPEMLLDRYGWSTVGDVQSATIVVPADFTLRSGHAPWRVWLDLSKSVGLDFSSQAGETVKILRYKVRDLKGRLRDDDLQAILLVDPADHPIGAWLAPIEGAGMGYSIEGKDLEHVTDLSWAQYLEKAKR